MNPYLHGDDLPPLFDVDQGVMLTWQYASTAVGLVVLVWSVYQAVARRAPLPLLMFIGGLLLSLSDPLYNSVFHIRYADNFPVAFVGFGIATPAFMPLAYAGYSVVGYFVYRSLLNGVTLRKVMAWWAAIFVIDIAFQGIASSMGAFTFDGDQPFEFGGWGIYLDWFNAIGFIFIGALLLFTTPRLRGWRVLFLISVPVVGHLAGVFAAGWPMVIALNWNVSVTVAWLLGCVSLVSSLILAWAVATLATAGPKHDDSASASDSPERTPRTESRFEVIRSARDSATDISSTSTPRPRLREVKRGP